MNEIEILNNNGYGVVDSRIIANGFDNEHRSLVRVIQKYFPDLKSIKSTSNSGNRGRPEEYYYLNKEQIMILPAICKTTEKTVAFQIRLVNKIIEFEQKLKAKLPIDPQDQAYMLADALIVERQLRLETQEKNLLLETKIKQDEPKIDTFKALMDSKTDLTIGQFAKSLGIGEYKLFQILRDEGILISKGIKRNLPHQSYQDSGYFRVINKPWSTDKKSDIYQQTVVTPKGQHYLVKRLNKYLSQPQLGL